MVPHIPNYKWFYSLSSRQKEALYQMVLNQYNYGLNRENTEADLSNRFGPDNSQFIHLKFVAYWNHLLRTSNQDLSPDKHTDLSIGEIIIRKCPHTGKPVLTQVLDDYGQIICLHKENEGEELQDIYEYLGIHPTGSHNVIHKTLQTAFSTLLDLRLGLKPRKLVNEFEDKHELETYHSVKDFLYSYCYNQFTIDEKLRILHYINWVVTNDQESEEWSSLIEKMDDSITYYLKYK